MLIQCPECGREVSDKAPACPHCGVPIAGNIMAKETNNSYDRNEINDPKQKTNKGCGIGMIFLVSLILVLIIIGALYYFYNQNKVNEEQYQYETALQSENPNVLQYYLNTYHEASREHRDSIQVRLTALNNINREWNDAVIRNTRAALQQYIDKYPGSKHEAEAKNKIDSMDWSSARSANTPEAIESYKESHPNGRYIDEALSLIRSLNARIVQPEERQMISGLFRKFFQGVNTKDEDRMISAVNTLLTTFLGKSDATQSDVITFMKKLWKDDVLNLNWHIIDDYNIQKKEVGNGEYEFIVTFSATQDVLKSTGTIENKYRIKAKVNPNGKISEMNMSKILE